MAQLALWIVVVLFAAAALAIALGGTKLAGFADRLADRTGLGEAITGAVLLGGSTSLPGIVTSVTTAAQGYPTIAISNAVGGIAAQTAFLGIADLAYRRVNLEHAAASAANLTQGALLVTLLAVPLMAMASPPLAILGVHPGTLLLVGGYLFGLRLLRAARDEPMWWPRQTRDTQREDEEPAEPDRASTAFLWVGFVLLALVVAGAGYVVSQAAIALTERTGIDETVAGGLLTAVTTSLPELVTSVAAVRRGALTLAVGNVIGGNSFDTLLLALSDVAYREGSLYHEIGSDEVFVVSVTIMMTGVLVLGLLRRQRAGVGGIGFESAAILALYALAVAVLML